MGKRILAICCTPYQLLVAAQVLACYYPGEEADLILSDQMSGARKLWEQAKDIWPYGQVYYLEERRLNRLAHKENAKNILLGAVAPEKLLERFLHLEGSYDVFLFSNISLMNQYLILALKRRNPGCNGCSLRTAPPPTPSRWAGWCRAPRPKCGCSSTRCRSSRGCTFSTPKPWTGSPAALCTSCLKPTPRPRWSC